MSLLHTLINALKNEPLDLVFENAIRKIIFAKPVNLESAFFRKIAKRINTYKSQKKYIKSILKRITDLDTIPSFYIIIKDEHLSSEQLNNLLNQINNLLYPEFSYLLTSNKIHKKIQNNNLLKETSKNILYNIILDNPIDIKEEILIELSIFINKENSNWFYLDHNELQDDSMILHKCKPSFNIDYYLAYDFIKTPFVVNNKLISLKSIIEYTYTFELILRNLINHEKPNRLSVFGITTIAQPKSDFNKQKRREELVSEYLANQNVEFKLKPTKQNDVIYIERKVNVNPLISIIIPFKDQFQLLKNCVESIITKTDYYNYELLLISNNSTAQTINSIHKDFSSNINIRLLEYNFHFNYSAINNWAVKKAKGEIIVFLNNDTKVINNEWLTNMIRVIQRPEVGAVGAQLLYPDNTIQHAGVVTGIGHVAGHIHRYFRSDDPGYMNRIICEQELSAITGACLMISKELFNQIGNFDEINLPISNNDVDLCLRVRESGFKIIYTPFAKLYHYESKSRKSDLGLDQLNRYKAEVSYMKHRYPNIDKDPFYSKNLTILKENFELDIKI